VPRFLTAKHCTKIYSGILFDLVPLCQVSQCPPLRYGAVLSGLAMSTLAIWCRFVRSRNVHPCDMVPLCQVSRCQVSRFQRPHNVHHHGVPMTTTAPLFLFSSRFHTRDDFLTTVTVAMLEVNLLLQCNVVNKRMLSNCCVRNCAPVEKHVYEWL